VNCVRETAKEVRVALNVVRGQQQKKGKGDWYKTRGGRAEGKKARRANYLKDLFWRSTESQDRHPKKAGLCSGKTEGSICEDPT